MINVFQGNVDFRYFSILSLNFNVVYKILHPLLCFLSDQSWLLYFNILNSENVGRSSLFSGSRRHMIETFGLCQCELQNFYVKFISSSLCSRSLNHWVWNDVLDSCFWQSGNPISTRTMFWNNSARYVWNWHLLDHISSHCDIFVVDDEQFSYHNQVSAFS
jgi:hypothetical protein